MKMNISRYGFMISILAICLSLFACGSSQDERDMQNYITELKKEAAQKEVVSKPIVLELPKPVTYGPDTSAHADKASSTKSITNPLQAYPVKSLQFVGTLTQNNQISAYVMTPDSMIYLVKVGDVIGEDYGKIISIDSDHIVISEKIMEGNQTVEHRIKMELKDSSQ